MRLRFGDVTFDGEARKLLRAGGTVHLTPKALSLLALLLERRPAAVARAEIQETLWPDVVVTEGNIDSLVKELRKAIGGGGGETTVVRTVHGFGYAFDGVVQEDGVGAAGGETRHVLVWGARTFHLADGENVLGRVREAAVFLGHDSVSRAHARITVDGDRAEVADLGSRNGTFLRGERAEEPVVLADGDDLGLGCVRLIYRHLAAGASSPTRSTGRSGRLTARSGGRRRP